MLTHADIEFMEFEETHPRHTGLKVDAIRARFGVTAAFYYQRLHRLVRRQDVLERWPQTAYRVQRRVERKRHEREELLQMIS